MRLAGSGWPRSPGARCTPVQGVLTIAIPCISECMATGVRPREGLDVIVAAFALHLLDPPGAGDRAIRKTLAQRSSGLGTSVMVERTAGWSSTSQQCRG